MYACSIPHTKSKGEKGIKGYNISDKKQKICTYRFSGKKNEATNLELLYLHHSDLFFFYISPGNFYSKTGILQQKMFSSVVSFWFRLEIMFFVFYLHIVYTRNVMHQYRG